MLAMLSGGGLLVLVLLAAWLGGCFSAKDRRQNQAAGRLPAAQLKTEIETPLAAAADGGQPPLKDSLVAVADAVGAKAGLLDDPQRLAAPKGRPSWADQREAAGPGTNLRRNWELHFDKGTAREPYARQLDFFGIELAVVLPENKLLYVGKFTKGKPETRSGAADRETRCYLTWSEGDLSRADADLLFRAGVSTADRVILEILPVAVEDKLAALEKAYAGDEIDNVRKTRFGIRAAGDGYEFYVVQQSLREQAKK
jgi:hypothetical protein